MSELNYLNTRLCAVALGLLRAWMGERFFRTFRQEEIGASAFDALLTQRERRVGVTIGLLWDGEAPSGGESLAELIEDELEDTPMAGGGYVIWIPPGGELPDVEPRQSELRLAIARAVSYTHLRAHET